MRPGLAVVLLCTLLWTGAAVADPWVGYGGGEGGYGDGYGHQGGWIDPPTGRWSPELPRDGSVPTPYDWTRPVYGHARVHGVDAYGHDLGRLPQGWMRWGRDTLPCDREPDVLDLPRERVEFTW